MFHVVKLLRDQELIWHEDSSSHPWGISLPILRLSEVMQTVCMASIPALFDGSVLQYISRNKESVQ